MVLTEQKDSVLKIFLNRPDKFNSFNREMSMQLQKALDEAAANENIRAVLLSGKGKAFCAGQDLSEAIDGSGPGIEKIVEEHYNPVITKIRFLEKPVVCAVNGIAAGAGANIALACDIIIAAKNSSFIQAFSKIGLIPDSGGTFILPRLIGWQRASALMMLGEKVSSDEAMNMGMIYKVCEDAELENISMHIATTLSEMPTKGLGLTKQLLNKSFYNSLEGQLKEELHAQVKAAQTEDFREGVTAFLEKRKGVFKGK